jgi:hypothetical protein
MFRSLAILLAQFKRLPIFVAGGGVAAAGVATCRSAQAVPRSLGAGRKYRAEQGLFLLGRSLK